MLKKKLTEYSLSGGCGCKINPVILKKLLEPLQNNKKNKSVKVDSSKSDDAAVFALNKKNLIVCSTDFFVPIVDNAKDFGKIAATNAISDIYAMGAQPLFALSILGVPKQNISSSDIKKILHGAKMKCEEANIDILGGHTIEINEPIFGLVVIGKNSERGIITNSKAKCNDIIILTKPLGIGIYSAAYKKKLLNKNGYDELIKITTLLNKPGNEIPKRIPINAMTDVTGFGLLGHLLEVCLASEIEATIYKDKIPLMKHTKKFLQENISTGASKNNFSFVNKQIKFKSQDSKFVKTLLCDPQTSGGLLIFTKKKYEKKVMNLLTKNNFSEAKVIGEVKKDNKFKITIL